jgi:hypothetical protein
MQHKNYCRSPKTNKHIVQCTRCQCYGHIKTHCAKPYACVKCRGNNNTLCAGNLPASYKGYEVYKNQQINRGKPINQITRRPLQQRINVNDSNQFRPISLNQTQNQMPTAPQTSYSQVLKQNQQSPHIANQFSTFLSSRQCSINSLNKTV